MSLVQNIKDNFNAQVENTGIELISTIYNDINSSSLLTFEIVNQDKQRVKSFVFPIMPESISISENNLMSINKTAGGISVTKNNSFAPKQITMNGTFGRTFKSVIPDQLPLEFAGVSLNFTLSANTNRSVIDNRRPNFSNFAKTGFGCLTLLNEMYSLSNRVEQDGSRYYLVGYFGIFGKEYVIEINSISQAETISSNMIPRYSINATAIAEYSSDFLSDPLGNLDRLTKAGVQRTATNLANTIVSSTRSIL